MRGKGSKLVVPSFFYRGRVSTNVLIALLVCKMKNPLFKSVCHLSIHAGQWILTTPFRKEEGSKPFSQLVKNVRFEGQGGQVEPRG